MEKKKRSSSLPVKSNTKVPKNNLKRACKSIPDACLKWSSPKPLFELHWVNSFIFFKFLVLFPWDFMFFYCEIISNLQESDKSSTRDSWIPLTSITWMWIFYHKNKDPSTKNFQCYCIVDLWFILGSKINAFYKFLK